MPGPVTDWWCPYHGLATPASMTSPVLGSDQVVLHCGYKVSPTGALCIARVLPLKEVRLEVDHLVDRYFTRIEGAAAEAQTNDTLEAVVGDCLLEAGLREGA